VKSHYEFEQDQQQECAVVERPCILLQLYGGDSKKKKKCCKNYKKDKQCKRCPRD
jgi:hypothetical protein